ncbi:hypothetical protein C2E21_5123 [Chlorella sorokiniana]|uniref:Uncharacterized protein n=1 Tax=Chlorella sorokiniana TaxID=3076 RepID=A0A2P6TPL8_CHLSO|nr:hypothetical protein C2E21_5123 [Chlorella sorokiniana]|eukprot:PRW55980.1 hypothetical protein C2E21_5123 [Chlorella sorokiniana]
MAARPARRSVAPVAALDPSAVEALYQVQEFGLTIMGVGIVSTFAAGMAQTLRRAAATYTTTAAATVAAEAPAAAPVAAAAPATALEQQPAAPVQKAAPVAAPAPVAPVLELSDIKSELQQAAAAAVAAVKSAAAAEPAPPAKPAAVAPAPAANGAAVKPGLTVEEATQQVKDWISAWQTSSESKPAESLEFPAREAAPTTRVTEPSLPSSAAAVLNAMTADAPVGATPVGEEGPASQGPPTEEKELTAVAAAAAPAEPAADGGAAEKEAEYKARISAVMADAKQQQAAKAQRVADQMRKRVVEMGVGYQAKIDSLWQGYESKKAEEAALLAKSEAILANLAEREAEERRLQESIAELEAARKSQAAEVEQGPLPSLLARILAFFQQIQSWLQQLWASLTGGSGSGSAAGASA